MPNKIFISTVLLMFLFFMGDAFAQNCSTPYEMVTKLHTADPGTYSVWDSLYGAERRDEKFISVVNDGYEVFAVGEVRSSNYSKMSMVFVRFDRRGRKKWERSHSIKGLKKIVKMLPYDDGYIVTGNNYGYSSKSSVWIGFFDKNGKLKSQKFINDNKYDLSVNDIVASADKKKWVMAVTLSHKIGEGKSKIKRRNAAIYFLDKNGKKISNRKYTLSGDNEITGLSVSKYKDENAGYIATGYFENSNGKRTGWILRLDEDTSYVWQKEFGRGLSANIKFSAEAENGDILALGEAKSVTSGEMGGWLMALNGDNGELLWQRFYYAGAGTYNYNAGGLYIGADGLSSVMMMAEPVASKNSDDEGKYISYSHVLTVDKRGVTLSGDTYYMGEGISISQMVEGVNRRRVMIGSAHILSADRPVIKKDDDEHIKPLIEKDHIDLPKVELSEKAKHGLAMLKNKIKNQGVADIDPNNESDISSNNAWIVVGAPPEAYFDPCSK